MEEIALTTPSSIRHPAAAGGLSGISRLIRQICLLRAQAEPVQAARLQETELAEAVREFRAAHGSEALPESELQAMFSREESRVADAVILAELLVPRLVSGLPVSTRPIPDATHSAPSLVEAARRNERGAPDIPDLLDAMLAAERNGRR